MLELFVIDNSALISAHLTPQSANRQAYDLACIRLLTVRTGLCSSLLDLVFAGHEAICIVKGFCIIGLWRGAPRHNVIMDAVVTKYFLPLVALPLNTCPMRTFEVTIDETSLPNDPAMIFAGVKGIHSITETTESKFKDLALPGPPLTDAEMEALAQEMEDDSQYNGHNFITVEQLKASLDKELKALLSSAKAE